MPPLPLTHLLHTALPGLSRVGRAVVSTLACSNGAAPSAHELAVSVGLRDRHQLARRLRQDGLPPLERLAGWTRVLYWMLEAKSSDASLLSLAHRDRLDPAAAYRLVRRVTGLRWSEARRAGVTVALLRLQHQCAVPMLHTALEPAEPRHRREIAAVGPPVAAPFAGPCGPRAEPGGAPGAGARHRVPCHPEAVLRARLPVSGNPFDVAIAPTGIACVTRGRAAAVDCLELSPLRVVGSVSTGAAPTRVVVSPAGEEAYVTNQFTDDVAIVDLLRRRRSGAVSVMGDPVGAALSPDARTLYVATNVDRLCAISVAARRVVASVPVPLVCSGLGVHPSGRRVYVPTWRAGCILEVDARTLQTARRFEVGGAPQDLAVSADGVMLYCANQGGWLDAIHLGTGRMTRVLFGTAAFSVALSPDEAVMYVGLRVAGRVVEVDRPTLQVRGRLETGGRPRRIAFDPTGHCALIANEAGWVDLVG
ncbi:MAG TPA: YncE family protein [Gemmatimonadales bacterium]|nr:YncE family protein [Gemmatimonadales bacterium]